MYLWPSGPQQNDQCHTCHTFNFGVRKDCIPIQFSDHSRHFAILGLETVIPYIAIQSLPCTILCIAFCVVTSMSIFFLDKLTLYNKNCPKNLPCIHQNCSFIPMDGSGNVKLDPFTKPPVTPTRPWHLPSRRGFSHDCLAWELSGGRLAAKHHRIGAVPHGVPGFGTHGKGVQVCDGRLLLLCQGRSTTDLYVFFGMVIPPLMTGILMMGIINPYYIRLMSLSLP